MTDIVWKGRIEKLNRRNGNKNGRDWDYTSFLLCRPYTTREGEQREEKWLMDAWKYIKASEGQWFIVGANLYRKKKENSDDWETRLSVEWAVPDEEVHPDLASEEQTPQPKPQPTRPQTPPQTQSPRGYSAPKPSSPAPQYGYSSKPRYAEEAKPVDLNGATGPEDFREEDIPF